MEKALEKFEHSIKDMPRTYGEASLNNDVAKLKYDKPLNLKTDKNVLPRTLSVYSGAMQNIGCNIGAGIFILQGSMLADVGSCGLVIVYFFIGGLISFFGAWSYIELGTMIPISGGAKEYLNAAFPKPRGLVTFVYTQVAIWLIMPGQTAAVATGAGMYLMTVIYGSKDICVSEGILSSSAYDYMARGISSATVITIVLIFSIIPRAGTLIQNYMSTLKSVVLLLALSVGAVAVCGGIKGLHTSGNFNNMFENSIYEPQSHISALFKVLFIFDGWGTINYSLSELKDPIRSMPLVTFGAFFTTFFLFLGTTVAYFAVVPITLLGDGKDIIAVQFFKMTMGDFVGGKVIPFLIFVAAASCAMSFIYAYSRLIMQASKDGILPPQQVFGKVSRFESPLNALFLGGFVTLLLIIGPPPGEAYDFLVLLSSYPLWVFYGLALIGLIVMRFTQPEMKRPVRTFIPGTIFFIICCVMLAFVPFIKPKGISTTGAPYWLVPTLGSSIILLFAMMRYVYSRWVCKDDGGNEKDIFEVAANAHLEIEKSNQA